MIIFNRALSLVSLFIKTALKTCVQLNSYKLLDLVLTS